MRTHLPFLLGALALLGGCDRVQAFIHPPAPGAHAAAGEKKPHDAKKDEKGKDEKGEAHGAHEPVEYALPFAWETSAAEPLGRTRSFLKDMYVTNGDYMQIGQKLFPTFADKQTPRATVVSCADSRVHTSAFDASPENDDFLVRNIGNQVGNALGSVQYGVEHLNTPLLLILGHTGCGAVKAAMGGIDKLEAPIQKELADLHPPERDPKKSEREAWIGAVIDNVHEQVAFSLAQFGRRVHAGKLTIVGAVLDLRNDLGLGAGRLVLVDVNGNRDQKRVAAFIEAVTGKPAPEQPETAEHGEEPGHGARPHARDDSTQALLHALASLPPSRARRATAAPEGTPAENGHDHRPE